MNISFTDSTRLPNHSIMFITYDGCKVKYIILELHYLSSFQKQSSLEKGIFYIFFMHSDSPYKNPIPHPSYTQYPWVCKLHDKILLTGIMPSPTVSKSVNTSWNSAIWSSLKADFPDMFDSVKKAKLMFLKEINLKIDFWPTFSP